MKANELGRYGERPHLVRKLVQSVDKFRCLLDDHHLGGNDVRVLCGIE